MRKKRNSSEGRLNKQQQINRDEAARRAIKAKYEQEGLERIKHNEEVIAANEDAIKKIEKALEFKELQLQMENAKLPGLKVLRPTFEFETTEIWEELQSKIIKLGIKSLEEHITAEKERVETLLLQNQKCLLENEQQQKRIAELEGATFDGEEVSEDIEIIDIKNNKLAS